MRVILFLILCILLNHYVFAEDFTGKVISITDGDTVTVLTDNKQTKVRLAEIDTPEKNQPYGKNAKKARMFRFFGKLFIEINQLYVLWKLSPMYCRRLLIKFVCTADMRFYGVEKLFSNESFRGFSYIRGG